MSVPTYLGSALKDQEPAPRAPVVKTCAKCGRAYTAESWRRLEYVGPLDSEFALSDADRARGARSAEMRNCPCPTTIAVMLDANGEPMLTE